MHNNKSLDYFIRVRINNVFIMQFLTYIIEFNCLIKYFIAGKIPTQIIRSHQQICQKSIKSRKI